MLVSVSSLSSNVNKSSGANKDPQKAVETSLIKAPPSLSNPIHNKDGYFKFYGKKAYDKELQMLTFQITIRPLELSPPVNRAFIALRGRPAFPIPQVPFEAVLRSTHLRSQVQHFDERFLVEESNRLIGWPCYPLRKHSTFDIQKVQPHDGLQPAIGSEIKSSDFVEKQTGKENFVPAMQSHGSQKCEEPVKEGIKSKSSAASERNVKGPRFSATIVLALQAPSTQPELVEVQSISHGKKVFRRQRELPLKKKPKSWKLEIETKQAEMEEAADLKSNGMEESAGVKLNGMEEAFNNHDAEMEEAAAVKPDRSSQTSTRTNSVLNSESSNSSTYDSNGLRKDDDKLMETATLHDEELNRKRGRPQKDSAWTEANAEDCKAALFDEMPMRDTVSWNIMMSGFLKERSFDAGFGFFKQMQSLSFYRLDQATFTTFLSASSMAGELDQESKMIQLQYPTDPNAYKILEEIGGGGGAKFVCTVCLFLWWICIAKGNGACGIASAFSEGAVMDPRGNVSVGASITAADDSPSRPSSSGEFAFGFRKGSKVQLTADGGLVLADPQGNPMWTSGISLGAVSSGAMNDTGILVLQNRNSDRLWESFHHPTDTLLPTQIMETEEVVSSRRTETNFSTGRFQLYFQPDGNLVLNSINLPTKIRYNPPFYATGTNDASNSSNSGYQLIFNEATLNFEGVFTQYVYPKTSTPNRSWSPNDERGNCIPDFKLSCKDDGQNSTEGMYDFVELRNVDYPSSDAEHLKPHNEEQCRKACLNDCLCAAVIFSGNNCWKKKLPVSNGRRDSTFNGKTLIKFRKGYIPSVAPGLQIPETKSKWDIKVVTGIVLWGSSVFVNCIFVGIFSLCSSFTYRNNAVNVREGNNVETNLGSFTYKELTKATEDFKDKLGRGAFGVVYKGAIQTGFTNFIAVKKLDGVARDGEKEFKAEVNVIGQTHHKNLSETKTAIRETKGYVAPEWFRSIPVNVKVDVYSFGVMLLEIICFVEEAHGALDALIEDDIEAMTEESTLERLLKVAIWCIQENPSLRPTMRKVTRMLEGLVEVPVLPHPYPFSEVSSKTIDDSLYFN
ncbi:unnamed protein product [Dovyalis caffra]|uniref:Uncharacterized protein n=1 Tax=Dovyalis caffra TaxID=77055 RepID=A0AAV1RUT3_9ROSI|nr:unnamed protein product [Dovyalis caffra]